MADASYWNDRVERYGDTGWKNRQIFDYDQQLRLRTIESLLKSVEVEARAKATGRCLDFGCGVGDFVPTLLSRFDHVIGMDISEKALDLARARFKSPDVSFVSPDAELSPESVDLVLSITVAMHLSDEVLGRTLGRFFAALRPRGFVFCMDTYHRTGRGNGPGGNARNRSEGDYLRMRSLEAFSEAAVAAGFEVKQVWNYYHPLRAPTWDFLSFAALCLSSNVLKTIVPRSLSSRVVFDPAKFGYPRRRSGIITRNSPTKIVLLRKP